jgi:predicted ester cyclase
VAIAEWQFRAGVAAPAKGREVGTSELAVMTFAPDGRIREEHDYMNQGSLRLQAEGDPDAPALPEVPLTSEVHEGAPLDAAGALAWTARYENACSNDDAAAVSMLDEHVTWRCTLGFAADSREPFPGLLAHWRAAFPDEHYTADRVWPVEDFIIVEETMTGTHKGRIGPYEGTGRRVTWHLAEVWQIKDARITHGWSYASFGELRPQVSDAPPPSTAEVPCSG